MPNSIKLEGWKEFEAKLAHMPADLLEEVDGEMEDAAAYWEELAKRDAPTDKGILAPAITHHKVTDLQWEVTSPIEYSPYVEWGTGSRAIIPAGYEDYAAQWWTRKIHVGRYPHPFFFIQKPTVEKFLFDNVNKILQTAH